MPTKRPRQEMSLLADELLEGSFRFTRLRELVSSTIEYDRIIDRQSHRRQRQRQRVNSNSTTGSGSTANSTHSSGNATNSSQVTAGAHSSTVNITSNSKNESVFELETTFEGSKGSNGIMFDVSTPDGDHEVEILALDIHTNVVQDDCPVLVYGRQGTHVGFENATDDWSLLVNATVKCLGTGTPTPISSSLFRQKPILQGGDSYSFYTQMPTPIIKFTNGLELGAIFSSSQFLSIHEGTGVGDFFGGPSQAFVHPRVWNGVVTYQVMGVELPDQGEVSTGCDANLTTTYKDNLGSYGNMFDVVTRNSSIVVHGVDIYTDMVELVTYEIFTRLGTFNDDRNLQMENESGNATDPTLPPTVSNIELMLASNWTLVKRGAVIGEGSGKGTPIRNFVPFTIPPDSLQGFYITLTQPDLRYQDITVTHPDAAVGDMYYDNDAIEIQMGISVGTYPVTSVFYGPRVWSGAIYYTASRDCPSEAPSEMPSVTPTIAPSQQPSQEISYLPSLGLPDFGNCTNISKLETPLDGGTESYGAMFTVTSSEPLSILSMDINVATKDEVYVEIYSKSGDYIGFQEDPSSWRIVAAVNVTGAGSGVLTVIPETDFDDVNMEASETQAFYVTLSSAHLKYSRTSLKVGEVLVYDEFISINAGAGIAAADFGGSVFEPRTFNGALHYLHDDDCIEEVVTSVLYKFDVQLASSVTESNVIQTINDNVMQTVKGLVAIDSTLRSFAMEYAFEFSNTTTYPAASGSCTAMDSDGTCVPLETNISFTHLDTLDPGKVKVAMLQYRETIGQNLELAGIQANYDGDVVVRTEVVISMNGNFTDNLSESEMQYFQAISQAFLKAQLSEKGIDILDVMAQESGNGKARFLQRSNDDITGSSSSIDVGTVIDGAYRPPPEIDFSAVVEDALDADGGAQFRDDLANGRRDIPPEIRKKAGAFQTVTSVNATALRVDTNTEPKSSGSSTMAILGGVLGALFALLIVVWCRCRRKRKAKRHGQLVNIDGPLAGMKRGMFGDMGSKGLFESAPLDADCTYVVSHPLMNDNGMGRPNRPGSATVDTLSTSSGFQDEWAKGSSSSFQPDNQQHPLVRNVPVDIVSSRYEESADPRRGAPMPGRDIALAIMNDRQNSHPDMSSVTRQRNLMYDSSGQSSANLQSAHEKSMSSIGSDRRNPMAFDRSIGSLDNSGRIHFPVVPSLNSQIYGNRSPIPQEMAPLRHLGHGKSMSHINRLGNGVDSGPVTMMRGGMSLSNLDTAKSMPNVMRSSGRGGTSPVERFDDEVLIPRSSLGSLHMGAFAPIARRFNGEDVGNQVGGYHHRDEREASQWQNSSSSFQTSPHMARPINSPRSRSPPP